jgi:hypothetical protein
MDTGDQQHSLPLEVQALVKTEVNAAMDVARQHLEDEFRQDRRDATTKALIRYGVLVLANMIFGFVIWWVSGPDKVRDWTQEFVRENMNKPTLDRAAQEVVAERMEHFTDEKLAPLSSSVDSLNARISDTFSGLDRIQEEQRLISFVNRAEAFDKDAFRQLQILAAGTNEVAPLAQAMLSKVQRTLILDRADMSFLVPVERVGETDYRGPFSNDELAYRLLGPSPDGPINIVGNDKRKVFIPRLVEIAHESKDLWTINRVAKALKEMGCVDFFPWDIGPLDRWWTDNKASYTNWPYALYSEGNGAFGACRYREALDKLNQVLEIDPGADRSRAMAIACAFEIGDTNGVQTLRPGFVQKNGRWDRWVQCREVLETGTVHAATEAFADLARAYPTFKDSAWIGKGNHVLRKVDWAAYDELMKPDKEKASNNEMQPTK